MIRSQDLVTAHFTGLVRTLGQAYHHADVLGEWAVELADRLQRGHRLLVAGNGGSAAEAQHFTAELVGRYREDRPPFAAIALTAETATLTALGNDYGFNEVFARQVRAYGQAGDILMLLSTSGESGNLLAAATAAADMDVITWALTGDAPNALASMCTSSVCFSGAAPHVQECQLIAIHAICEVFDATIHHDSLHETKGRTHV